MIEQETNNTPISKIQPRKVSMRPEELDLPLQGTKVQFILGVQKSERGKRG
jgi:hypothetical protein